MEQIQVIVGGETRAFPKGTTAGEIFDAMAPGRRPRPLAATLYGRVRPLNWAPENDCELAILDYSDDEGRRIYERSLRFVLLLAVEDVLPGARVRIEHSVGYGLYISLSNLTRPLTDENVATIEARMRAICRDDKPFARHSWKREDAIAYFDRLGQQDKVRLLQYRPHAFFEMYECGGMYEYFYGDMLPSTGYLRAFALLRREPGLVLQMPAPSDPETPAPYVERPQMMRAFHENAEWLNVLGCTNVADLNEMIGRGEMAEFVRVNEALQEKSIAAIADQIAKRHARVVFVAGPSSSGKTTFTNRLAVQLRVNHLRPLMLSLDNYYRPLAEVPLDEDGKPDLECLEALDVPLLTEQLAALFRGEEVILPRYSFKTNTRKEEGAPLRAAEDQPILIEGIHGLNPRLTEGLPENDIFRIYISPLTALNLDDHNRIRTTDIRLLRRLVRDKQFRHSPFEETLAMWPSVRRGEEKFIIPYQEEADVMFNSALAYEPAMLKKYAYSSLAAIEEGSPYFVTARRMVKFLNYFRSADCEAELGPTAILREFIGGCSFYMKAK